MQDDGQGHQEIVPSLLTQDTLNPSFYGIRIIAAELEPIIDKLSAQVIPATDLEIILALLSRIGLYGAAIWPTFNIPCSSSCSTGMLHWRGMCVADVSPGMVQNQGRLRKAISHIKPRSKAERAAERAVTRRERAQRNKRRRDPQIATTGR